MFYEETFFLYQALLQLGQFYPLQCRLTPSVVGRELEAFSGNWVRYNSEKSNNPRYGLSLVSMDGGMSGELDLTSLKENNNASKHKCTELDFRVRTPALENSPHLASKLNPFLPYMVRSHFIRLDSGGFFPPHRDSQDADTKSFRLISCLSTTSRDFCFFLDDRQLFFDPGVLYFLNTKVTHSVFSYVDSVIFLVLNIELSNESVSAVIQNLATH